jgi:hypothetical protein
MVEEVLCLNIASIVVRPFCIVPSNRFRAFPNWIKLLNTWQVPSNITILWEVVRILFQDPLRYCLVGWCSAVVIIHKLLSFCFWVPALALMVILFFDSQCFRRQHRAVWRSLIVLGCILVSLLLLLLLGWLIGIVEGVLLVHSAQPSPFHFLVVPISIGLLFSLVHLIYMTEPHLGSFIFVGLLIGLAFHHDKGGIFIDSTWTVLV